MSETLDYITDPQELRRVLSNALTSTTRGVVAGTLGAPVDLANAVMNLGRAGVGYGGHKLGLLSDDQLPQLEGRPVGGSEWIGDKMQQAGLLGGYRNPTAEVLAGGLLGPAVVANAPRAATGLLQFEANAAAAAAARPTAWGQRGAFTPDGLAEALARLEAMKRGESPPRFIKGALQPTAKQQADSNAAFSQVTRGAQPPFAGPMDLNIGHIFDSRVSGAIKPSGQIADAFAPADVVKWLESAGADSAAVQTRRGLPHLENVFTDPVTGESFTVRIPISGDMATGRQWASGLIPEGKFKKEKP